MANKSTAHIADETREMRLKMWDLVQGGLSEDEAMQTLLTKFRRSNEKRPRSEKRLNLVYWREKGLWPPPEVQQSAHDEGAAIEMDTMTPIEVWGGAEPLPESAEHGESDGGFVLPDIVMSRIRGLITTTVNAAILDYHNTQQEHIRAEIARRIKEVLADDVTLIKTPDPSDTRDLTPPPRPRTMQGTRKHLVKREKLQGTCDKALFNLFEEDRNERGYNVSQMIDFILYNFYGKPPLSFQKDEID
jgi:hypothetical protein